jgi:hypothetical protein
MDLLSSLGPPSEDSEACGIDSYERTPSVTMYARKLARVDLG